MGRLADLYLPFRPGTDVAVLNGLMNVIISEGLEDRDTSPSAPRGMRRFRQVVAEYTPERVEEISGIPADGLRAAARMYATDKPAAIVYAMGITQHTTGTDNVKSPAPTWPCSPATWAWPGAGSTRCAGRTTCRARVTWAALPNVYPGYQPVTNA
jgi:anaerobic selenocysteine-containing dehydrogenase